MNAKPLLGFGFLMMAATAACSGQADVAQDEPTADDGAPLTAATVARPPVLVPRQPVEDPVVLEMERAPERFFTRRMSVADRTGETRMGLRVISNDPHALDLYTSAKFELQVGDEARRAPVAEDDGPEEIDADDAEETEAREKILIYEEPSASRRNQAIRLNVSFARDLKLPWKNFYHYTAKDCVDVTRLKLFRRVYVSMWSKASQNSGWTTLLSGEGLAWKETSSRCDNNSFEIKTKVRTKKSNAYSYAAWE